MVWFNIQLGKYKAKYTALNPIEERYPYCDEKGNVLTRVSGKYDRGYFTDKDGNRHEKAFRLINGKATAEFKGRIKEVGKYVEVNREQAEDILTEKEFLIESEQLYSDLTEKNKAVLFGGWFGNGYKAYKCYVVPSELYKGFCIMKVGRTQKSEIITALVGDLTETKKLQEKLAEIELTIQGVNRAKPEDLILIQ